MWKKNNPDEASGLPKRPAPAKRNADGLMGIKPSDPSGLVSRQETDKAPRPVAENAAGGSLPLAPENGESYAGAAFDSASQPAGPGGPPPEAGPIDDRQENWRGMIAFHGKGWEYFKLIFANLLLTIITLGLYAFWGKTKVRQYMWGNTEVLGQPLEYTGTGKELFISFLIVMPFFLGGMFAFQYAVMQLAGSPLFFVALAAFYLALLFLWLFASYRALRYRLTRTRWRGIRGNLSGSATAYAFVGMGYLLLVMITLGLATPWMSERLANMQMNNVWFGNRRLSFNGPAKELVKSFLIMLLGIFVILAVCFGVIASVLPSDFNDPYASQTMDYDAIYYAVMFVYLLLIIGPLFCSAYYQATFYRWLFGHMTYGKLAMRSRITGLQVLRLYLTNFFLVVFTLGIGYAWARMRYARLLLHSVDCSGDPELNALLQDTQAAPSRGEGLLDALDMDIGF